MDAFATLTRSGFGLYLYCSGNMNGYEFSLSSQAIQNQLGISDSSYRRAIKELLENGYFLEGVNDKTLHFYTTPQPTSYVAKPKKKKGGAAAPPIFEEAPAPDPIETTVPPLMSSSLDFDYCWED